MFNIPKKKPPVPRDVSTANRREDDARKMANLKRTVFLDMGGTIADTYRVENWLERLNDADYSVFKEAEPVNPFELKYFLDRLDSEVVILSMEPWSARDGRGAPIGTRVEEVYKVKREWIDSHFPYLRNSPLKLVSYKERKSDYRTSSIDILVDDSYKQTKEWKGMTIDPGWCLSLDKYFEQETSKLVEVEELLNVMRNMAFIYLEENNIKSEEAYKYVSSVIGRGV